MSANMHAYDERPKLLLASMHLTAYHAYVDTKTHTHGLDRRPYDSMAVNIRPTAGQNRDEPR
jgi:hypothetical protein